MGKTLEKINACRSSSKKGITESGNPSQRGAGGGGGGGGGGLPWQHLIINHIILFIILCFLLPMFLVYTMCTAGFM